MAHFAQSQALGDAFKAWARKSVPSDDATNALFAEAIMVFCDQTLIHGQRLALISQNVNAVAAKTATAGTIADPNASGYPPPSA